MEACRFAIDCQICDPHRRETWEPPFATPWFAPEPSPVVSGKSCSRRWSVKTA